MGASQLIGCAYLRLCVYTIVRSHHCMFSLSESLVMSEDVCRPDYAAGYFFARIAGWLGGEIIGFLMDDN